MTHLQLSCENKLQTIAHNFKDMGNALYAMGIITCLERELYDTKSIAGYSIKAAIERKEGAYKVIETVKDQLEDGWKELSPELSDKILKFKY